MTYITPFITFFLFFITVTTVLSNSQRNADLQNSIHASSVYGDQNPSVSHGWILTILAVVLFIWYLAIISVSLLGVVVLKINQQDDGIAARTASSSSSMDGLGTNEPEGVTIIRPVKGIDTEMDACLSSTFVQKYSKFELLFCVESPSDPAIPIVEKLIKKYPSVDARLLIDNPNDNSNHYGPNPKINNLAKGYKEAKYDMLWIIDSNVWVSPGTLARSVEAFKKPGRGGRKIKLVHHLPLCVSLDSTMTASWGSKLDEMFMLTSHSKFYTAINTVAIAPCVTGKSNLYRRSELDAAVSQKLLIEHQNKLRQRFKESNSTGIPLSSSPSSLSSLTDIPQVEPGTGLLNFSQYIAEDNMIALCLWENGDGRTRLTSDFVVQPLANVSLHGFWDRRVRWLRVRRFMVSAATYVEPTTESICSGIFGSFAIAILFLSNPEKDGLRYWSWTWFFFHMICWCIIDYFHFHGLLAFTNQDSVASRPYFVKKYFSPYKSDFSETRRSLKTWLPAWMLREVLAFPIWFTAMCSYKIYWRNRPFRILPDLSTEEILDSE